LTETLLSVNPEFYTLWGYRKEMFLKSKVEKSDEEIAALSKVELDLVEKALKRNPKSYVAWHHRKWTIDNGNVDLSRELQLCNQFLSMDSRNCKLGLRF
jgi:geranylgeranyl transferase type-2 subunit alpha